MRVSPEIPTAVTTMNAAARERARDGLQCKRVEEVAVQKAAVPGHLPREHAVLPEVAERRREDDEREPEGEDAEALRAEASRAITT